MWSKQKSEGIALFVVTQNIWSNKYTYVCNSTRAKDEDGGKERKVTVPLPTANNNCRKLTPRKSRKDSQLASNKSEMDERGRCVTLLCATSEKRDTRCESMEKVQIFKLLKHELYYNKNECEKEYFAPYTQTPADDMRSLISFYLWLSKIKKKGKDERHLIGLVPSFPHLHTSKLKMCGWVVGGCVRRYNVYVPTTTPMTTSSKK